MKTMNEYKDQELQWLHPNKFKGEYELRGGDEVFARFHLKGTCGSQMSSRDCEEQLDHKTQRHWPAHCYSGSKFTSRTGHHKT